MKILVMPCLPLVLSVACINGLSGQVPATRQGGVVAYTHAGAFDRKEIPGDYLEVDVTRGTLHVQGIVSDRLTWQLAIVPDPGPASSSPHAVDPGSLANALGYGNAIFKDHYQFVAGIGLPDRSTYMHADIKLNVPRDLKLLHVNVYGNGRVIVDGFAGELSVRVDSGDIVGTNLSGAVLLEARNGSIDLDLAQSPFAQGPVNLLSHNGSVNLLLASQPSVVLDLSTNCGEINSAFPLTAAMAASGHPSPPRSPDATADCALRPKSLPPLTGVDHLRYQWNLALGAGAMMVRAMALQGDINIKKMPNE